MLHKWVGVAEFQFNFIYGRENWNFICFALFTKFFLHLILIQPFKKVKAILNLRVIQKQLVTCIWREALFSWPLTRVTEKPWILEFKLNSTVLKLSALTKAEEPRNKLGGNCNNWILMSEGTYNLIKSFSLLYLPLIMPSYCMAFCSSQRART